jgi:glycosyltransferase involved in cell wall biosynthesis
MNRLSVIICTYNPDVMIFEKCLSAIAIASDVLSPFEIIIIDNNSKESVESLECVKKTMSGSVACKVIREMQQGLTPARICGIRNAMGDVIVFIDDDNFIRPNFFKAGMDIANANSHIGAWSGQVKIVFDKEPEAWTKKYWGLLVHRQFKGQKWSNFPNWAETMPCGAGLFVRRNVADYYLYLHEAGRRVVQLDRAGSSLFSGGDNDLAACACDIGMGVGLFDSLELDHFIPEDRFSKAYLLKLAQGIAASAVVFRSFRGEMPHALSYKRRVANTLRMMVKSSLDRQFFRAVLKGEEQGRILVETYNKGASN